MSWQSPGLGGWICWLSPFKSLLYTGLNSFFLLARRTEININLTLSLKMFTWLKTCLLCCVWGRCRLEVYSSPTPMYQAQTMGTLCNRKLLVFRSRELELTPNFVICKVQPSPHSTAASESFQSPGLWGSQPWVRACWQDFCGWGHAGRTAVGEGMLAGLEQCVLQDYWLPCDPSLALPGPLRGVLPLDLHSADKNLILELEGEQTYQ